MANYAHVFVIWFVLTVHYAQFKEGVLHHAFSSGRDAPTIKMPTYLLPLQYSVLICIVMLTWSGIKKLRSGGVVKHNSKKDVARFWEWQYFWTISTPVFYGVEKKSKKRLRCRNCQKKCIQKEVTLAKEKTPDWAGTADSTASVYWCCFFYFIRNSLVALLEALFARAWCCMCIIYIYILIFGFCWY